MRIDVYRIAILLAAVSLAPACSTTTVAPKDQAVEAPAPPVRESGFLTDYTRLQPSAQSPDVLFWRDPELKRGFARILFRPVQVWRGADQRLEDVPESDLQYLADSFYRAMTTRLRDSFELVDKPGKNVLEIQLALTMVTKPKQRVDFFSTDVPVRDLPERTRPLDPATKAFIRGAAFEAEFAVAAPAVKQAAGADAKKETRKRPRRIVKAAFFDKRRGDDSSKGTVETWDDVDELFDHWAELLDSQLSDLKEGKFKPKLTTAPGQAPPKAAN